MKYQLIEVKQPGDATKYKLQVKILGLWLTIGSDYNYTDMCNWYRQLAEKPQKKIIKKNY